MYRELLEAQDMLELQETVGSLESLGTMESQEKMVLMVPTASVESREISELP